MNASNSIKLSAIFWSIASALVPCDTCKGEDLDVLRGFVQDPPVVQELVCRVETFPPSPTRFFRFSWQPNAMLCATDNKLTNVTHQVPYSGRQVAAVFGDEIWFIQNGALTFTRRAEPGLTNRIARYAEGYFFDYPAIVMNFGVNADIGSLIWSNHWFYGSDRQGQKVRGEVVSVDQRLDHANVWINDKHRVTVRYKYGRKLGIIGLPSGFDMYVIEGPTPKLGMIAEIYSLRTDTKWQTVEAFAVSKFLAQDIRSIIVYTNAVRVRKAYDHFREKPLNVLGLNMSTGGLKNLYFLLAFVLSAVTIICGLKKQEHSEL